MINDINYKILSVLDIELTPEDILLANECAEIATETREVEELIKVVQEISTPTTSSTYTNT